MRGCWLCIPCPSRSFLNPKPYHFTILPVSLSPRPAAFSSSLCCCCYCSSSACSACSACCAGCACSASCQSADYLQGPFDLVLCSDLIYLKISDDALKEIVASCLQVRPLNSKP